MKRPRSYEEDPDAKEKPSFKDWDRDRHHRRFYDDDRDPARSSRRRYDLERYRDGGGADRLHRSESFSALRRDFPKGFRSERSGRDRARREGSSSWQQQRRSSSERETSSSAAAAAAADVGTSRARRHSRSRDSSSGEAEKPAPCLAPAEAEGREEKVNRGSCSSSEMEMEEGELEPEPKTAAEPESGNCIEEIERKVESCEQNFKAGQQTEERLESGDGGKKEADESEEANEKRAHEKGEGEVSEKEKWILTNDRAEEHSIQEKKEDVAPIQREEKVEIQVVVNDIEDSRDKEAIYADANHDGGDNGEKIERRGIDLEAEPDSTNVRILNDNNQNGGTLQLMTDKPQENYKDKGKSVVISDLNDDDDYVENGDPGEGPSSMRGFELVFPSDYRSKSCGRIVLGKDKDDKPELEPLDLSLRLPGILPQHTSRQPDPRPSSHSHGRSFQSFPSSFRTSSDGFTASMSISGSQTFVHNPSCSLNQNSLDNFEQSVGSRPIFQGIDQVVNDTNTVWQAQASYEAKSKGGTGPLFQRILMNGNAPQNSLQAQNSHQNLKPNSVVRQSSLQRQISPAQSHGSRDSRNENKRLLTRERSSSSLFRSEPRDGERLVLNSGGFERIISKIVSEPLQVVGRIFQEMTDQSIAYLKETACEMIVNAEKHGRMLELQDLLQRRSDLTAETMARCPRNLLEILVALKTGLPDFVRRSTDNLPSSDLVDIFFNLMCRNLACRSMLPVDDCDCKVCVQKSGFCSACMCLVCSKFDTASNTCSWVGCDHCLHWCHTDCGLRESNIRNGPPSEAQGTTEMQFHCVACDHPSEMFGFVKDVFKTCAKSWKAETLAKELQYVKRIFSASNDVKGKSLCDIADQMLGKLEDKANLSEIISYIMRFFSDSETDTSNSPVFPAKEPSRNNAEERNRIAPPSKEAMWMPSSSYSLEKVPLLESASVLPKVDCDRVARITRDVELPLNPEKKPVVDELESVVRFKQAEAQMYQERADSARREAEGLKRIVVAKKVKIDEEYTSRLAKLRLLEAEERRKQKLEQLQVTERAHREYFNMKMRMESDINDLLLKMEAAKRNFNT